MSKKNEVQDVCNKLLSLFQLNDLPLELLDIVLQKSFINSALKEANQTVFQKCEDIFRQLATVDCCWSQRMTRRSFENAIWSKIRTNYRQKKSEHIIYRSNRQSLQESLKVFGKARTWKSTRYLSDIDGALLKTQKPSIFKKNRWPYDVFSLPLKNEVEINILMRYLHQRGKKIRNQVIENGGAAVRIEILSFDFFNKAEHIRQLAERLNLVIHDYASRSHDQEKAINQLKSDGIELMYAVEDKEVAVWILCKSPNAIEHLKELNKSKSLLDYFCHLFNFNGYMCQGMKPARVNIDDDQLKREIAGFSKLTTSFTENIVMEIPNMVYRCGISKLKDKIYVVYKYISLKLDRLDKGLCKICVFDDQSPFPMLGKIALEDEILEYKILVADIKSSENQNCLYVLEARSNRIWKIEPSGEMEYALNRAWLLFEQNFVPRAIYVSRDDHLLAVTHRSPVELRTYMTNAELLLSFELHEDIDEISGLAESSIGNFLILHGMKNLDTVVNEFLLCGAVSEVSRDGKTIIRRFSPRNSEQALILYRTYYICDICIDSEERLFVPDPNQNRVILLDSCLEWAGVLIDLRKDMNSRLQRIFYDERKRHLFIEDDAKISVYVLKRHYFFF